MRKVARHVGHIVSEMWDGTEEAAHRINAVLERYANSIRPWAESVAQRMITEVDARNLRAWSTASRKMGIAMRAELATAPTGEAVRKALRDQVDLITSLPRGAAQRVHRLTLEGLVQGTRFTEIADEIWRTGQVTASRATLIARTESSRTATELSKARAEHVGSTHFVWRTVGDADVRPSHRKLNGKVFRWDDPPECDPGYHALPGAIWNCRCYAEPMLADDD